MTGAGEGEGEREGMSSLSGGDEAMGDGDSDGTHMPFVFAWRGMWRDEVRARRHRRRMWSERTMRGAIVITYGGCHCHWRDKARAIQRCYHGCHHVWRDKVGEDDARARCRCRRWC